MPPLVARTCLRQRIRLILDRMKVAMAQSPLRSRVGQVIGSTDAITAREAAIQRKKAIVLHGA
jgi:hypothetical protein